MSGARRRDLWGRIRVEVIFADVTGRGPETSFVDLSADPTVEWVLICVDGTEVGPELVECDRDIEPSAAFRRGTPANAFRWSSNANAVFEFM